jgi:hypothetical protein
MAGSYNHAVTDDGKLRTKSIGIAAENQGDAYETIEEMYGMIWWLAGMLTDGFRTRAEMVERARQNYLVGLDWSPGSEEWD